MDEFDDAVGRVGDTAHQVAGAWTVTAVGGHPVGAGTEVVTRAADVNGPQGFVCCCFCQRIDERVGHPVAQRVAPRRAIEQDA